MYICSASSSAVTCRASRLPLLVVRVQAADEFLLRFVDLLVGERRIRNAQLLWFGHYRARFLRLSLIGAKRTRPGKCGNEKEPPSTHRTHPRAPRMRLGSADLTRYQMRAHFTIFPKRPAARDHADRRGRSPKAKHGRPAGPQMLCGWGCGADSRRARCVRTSHMRGAAGGLPPC